MNENNRTVGKQNCYQTGFTNPKKSYSGPMAVLLVAVIFLCGLCSILSLLNIHLFREITQDAGIAPATVRFADVRSREYDQAAGHPALGVSGQAVSGFEQRFYHIPQGFYITQVLSDSAAQKAGIQRGDIILYFDGQRVSGLESLKSLLYAHKAGDTVSLLLHRKGIQLSVELCLDEATE